MKIQAASGLIVLSLCAACYGQEGPPQAGGESPAPALDWKSAEPPLLRHHTQLTSRDQFVKAGEAYFSPDAKWVIFQAVPVPEAGEAPDPFYSMYVARVQREGRRIVGLDEPIRISPEGSWNSCGWFHPQEPWRVLFGSTITPPNTDQQAEFRVANRRYVWLFPEETQVVEANVEAIFHNASPEMAETFDAPEVRKVFERPRYDAECSYSPCGRFILYANVREEMVAGRPDADLWIYDTRTQQHHEIVAADGYDGGPFFSPDGKRICYRSDRQLNDRLQLFIADLKFDEDGVPVGIEREYQITDNEHVNWAPYWHPSGRFIVYGTSELGHWNYEVFAVEVDEAGLRAAAPAKALRKARITHAGGADILPVFSADGSVMMWTAQRGPMSEDEQRPSSQLWVAEFDAAALKFE